MPAEGGAAFTLLHPEFTVVVPQPDPVKLPYAFGLAPDAERMADAVNEWIVFAQSEGAIRAPTTTGFSGSGAEDTAPALVDPPQRARLAPRRRAPLTHGLRRVAPAVAWPEADRHQAGSRATNEGWPHHARRCCSTALRRAAAASALLAAVAMAAAVQGQEPAPAKPSVLVTSSAQRRAYLANATVWREKALPSPEAIVEGPPGNPGGSRAR